jgi:hypothetical protein
VAVVSGVAVPVVHVVDMVPVVDCLVPAPVTVGVGMIVVGYVLLVGALVPVPLVVAMGVSVVQVVGVIAVVHGDVPAVGAVSVAVIGVDVVAGHA